MFLPSHSLDTVTSSDMLFCFELLSKEMAKERVVFLRVQQVRDAVAFCTSLAYRVPLHTCALRKMGFCELASLAEAAGSQHPHLKVCCLPEASGV